MRAAPPTIKRQRFARDAIKPAMTTCLSHKRDRSRQRDLKEDTLSLPKRKLHHPNHLSFSRTQETKMSLSLATRSGDVSDESLVIPQACWRHTHELRAMLICTHFIISCVKQCLCLAPIQRRYQLTRPIAQTLSDNHRQRFCKMFHVDKMTGIRHLYYWLPTFGS